MTDKICKGCGVALQQLNKNASGYTPKLLDEATICERCYKLKFYNKLVKYDVDEIEYKKIFKKINSFSDKHICMVINVFNLTELSELLKLYNDFNYTIILNKFDLLPKSIGPKKIIDYIKKNYEIKKFTSFITTNSLNFSLTKDVCNYIYSNIKEKNIFFVGYANAGKSTLLNNVIEYSSNKRNIITTSNLHGTTLDLIKFNLKNKTVYDTPGILWEYSVNDLVDIDNLSMIFPKKEIKQVVFQLNTDQTVFIGDFAIFTIKSKTKNAFSFYFNDGIKLHRTNLENKERNIRRMQKENFNIEDKISIFKNFRHGSKMDIVIDNIGWISFYVREDLEISISHPKNLNIYERGALI